MAQTSGDAAAGGFPEQATPACQRLFDELTSLISFVTFVRQLHVGSGSATAGPSSLAKRLGAFSPLLVQMVFTRAVDAFLIFLSDVFGLIFTTRPETLRSREQVSIQEILEHDSLEGVIRFLAERRVEKLAYSGLSAVATDLANDLGFALFDADGLQQAVEIIEARNVVVHNRGIINSTYLRRVKRGVLGEELPVTEEFVIGSLGFLAAAAVDIDRRAGDKWALPSDVFNAPPTAVQRALVERTWPSVEEPLFDPEAG